MLRELKRQLPSENLIYFADTLHMPYGSRTKEELHELVFAILNFLQEQGVKLVIMACNTSSAVVLPAAREAFSMPILGMIEPLVRQLAVSPVKRLGVMATEATVRSGTYNRELRRVGFQGEVYSQPCPELAALIETGADERRLAGALQVYTSPLRQAQVEQVVLGCTHYPFVSEELITVFGGKVELIDPATYVVAEAKGVLEQEKMLCQSDTPGSRRAYVSGDLSAFQQRASQLLGETIVTQPVSLDQKL